MRFENFVYNTKFYFLAYILCHMYSTLFHMLYLYWSQAEGENPIFWKKEKNNNKFM